MNEANKRRQFMITLNLFLTALILLGVIVVVGWLFMLDRQVSQVSSAAGELAAQLTLQSTLDTYREEIATDTAAGTVIETEEPTMEEQYLDEEKPTAEPTTTPKTIQNELTEVNYEKISLIPSSGLDELSDQQYFRLPPLRINFPEGWKYRFDSIGTLTVKDSFDNETLMEIWADNSQTEFLLNEIGYFESLSDGGLGWYPDTTPRQGLGPDQYQLTIKIGKYTSEALMISVEDAPMARILESIPMYRTYEDIQEDRRYLSFASQQEPMSMFGYTTTIDGILYIRVWRAHDKYYYWVNGEFVMHPDKGLRYNSVEDLQDESGQEIIPKIDFTDH